MIYRCFAVTARGLEPTTQYELEAIGAQKTEAGSGGVHFEGDLETVYRSNLWLRTASRVLVSIRSFTAQNNMMLYDQVRRVHWEDYLSLRTSFCIDSVFSGQKGMRPTRFQNSVFTSQKIKDAIVDRLREKLGGRPNVNTENPDVRIHAYFADGKCTLSLDSSGHSLHERGYRSMQGPAPLKENLAAGIVLLSGWKGDVPLVDPMCGTGTLIAEAAMIALNQAPGLDRNDFGFQRWLGYDAKLFDRLNAEAREKRKKKLETEIFALDQHPRAIEAAEHTIRNALGSKQPIYLKRRRFEDLEPPTEKPGFLLMNPPYGERLANKEALAAFHKNMGDIFKQRMKGWEAWVFSGNLAILKQLGLRTSKRITLFNGPIECRLIQYKLF